MKKIFTFILFLGLVFSVSLQAEQTPAMGSESLYLVKIEANHSGNPALPPQMGPMSQWTVIPNLEQLKKLEDEGKITGGVVLGSRNIAFILKANSGEEVTQILHELPSWGNADIKVTPLEHISSRLELERNFVKRGNVPPKTA